MEIEDKREYIVNIFLERDIIIPEEFLRFLNNNMVIDKLFDIVKDNGKITLEMLANAYIDVMNDSRLDNDKNKIYTENH
jgi:hypothetical protein